MCDNLQALARPKLNEDVYTIVFPISYKPICPNALLEMTMIS